MGVVTTRTEIEEPTFFEGIIGEMSSDPSSGGLTVPEEFMTTVREADDNPMFVTVEVDSGFSKSKRRWKPEHLKQVVNKVNKQKMAGNLGHPLLDPKEHEQGFPIPQVVWVAAKSREIGSELRATFKGYVLKTAQARELLKLGLIDGVSIFGDSRLKPIAGGGYEVISFEPETIDFARKGRSGMSSRIVNLTGEQESKGGISVDAREVAALTPDEIKTHAPLVFKAIQDEATEPLNEKIGEMQTAAATMQPDVDVVGEIRKLLKLSDGDNVVEKVTNLLSTIENTSASEIRAYVKELVSKKVKTERGQALLNRLIGEMESTDYAFSSQFDGPLTDDLRKEISAKFEEVTNEDEDIKELVGEMAPSKEKDDGENTGGSGLGGRSRTGQEHGRGEGKTEKRGGLTVTRRRFADVG